MLRLRQIEDKEEKLKNYLHEISKPLARYADDADLDKALREQEKEGDPMLEYIRKKKIKEGKIKPGELCTLSLSLSFFIEQPNELIFKY